MDENINKIVDNIIAKKGRSPNTAIPILQAIQNEFNYLPEAALKRVCEITEITPSQITGVSTFYTQFRHNPVGKHIIKVCVGTACHVKGAMQVYDSIKRQLNLKDNEDTDSEGIYTIEKVACLGCCTIAPVIQIDDVTYGHVETEKVGEILDDFQLAKNNPKSAELKTFTKGNISQGEIRIGLGSCCVA
ncbi:MAG: NAD(P)H-dependent oxidoreductase subunit E, partial [Bacteroidota bacterium]